MRVAIIAAGYGTRLYPLTVNLPKPLLSINGKPIINFLMDKLTILGRSFPIEEIKVVTNNKFYDNFCLWNKQYGFNAVILNDGSNSPQDKLGAIGDMKFVIGKISDDWLILGGDNLFGDGLEKFMEFAYKNKPHCSIGLHDIKDKIHASHYGVVEIDAEKKVINFQEKPANPASSLIATCMYFFPRESLQLVDEFISSQKNVDASGKYIEWLSKRTSVFGYTLQGRWFDIGHKDSLASAEKEFR